MPPRKRLRLSTQIEDTTSLPTTSTLNDNSAVPPQSTIEEQQPQFQVNDAWTDEEEAALFRSIIKHKPTGLHKHMQMLSIFTSLVSQGYVNRDDQGDIDRIMRETSDIRTTTEGLDNSSSVKAIKHMSIQGIWSRLDSLYDLKTLDRREEIAVDFDAAYGSDRISNSSDSEDEDTTKGKANREENHKVRRAPIGRPFVIPEDWSDDEDIIESTFGPQPDVGSVDPTTPIYRATPQWNFAKLKWGQRFPCVTTSVIGWTQTTAFGDQETINTTGRRQTRPRRGNSVNNQSPTTTSQNIPQENLYTTDNRRDSSPPAMPDLYPRREDMPPPAFPPSAISDTISPVSPISDSLLKNYSKQKGGRISAAGLGLNTGRGRSASHTNRGGSTAASSPATSRPDTGTIQRKKKGVAGNAVSESPSTPTNNFSASRVGKFAVPDLELYRSRRGAAAVAAEKISIEARPRNYRRGSTASNASTAAELRQHTVDTPGDPRSSTMDQNGENNASSPDKTGWEARSGKEGASLLADEAVPEVTTKHEKRKRTSIHQIRKKKMIMNPINLAIEVVERQK